MSQTQTTNEGDRTSEHKAIVRLLNCMRRGRPSDPRDGDKWDRSVRNAERVIAEDNDDEMADDIAAHEHAIASNPDC